MTRYPTIASRAVARAKRRAYYVANGEKIRAKAASKQKQARAAKRRYYLSNLPPPDYIPIAKARVAADPLRHWRSPADSGENILVLGSLWLVG